MVAEDDIGRGGAKFEGCDKGYSVNCARRVTCVGCFGGGICLVVAVL